MKTHFYPTKSYSWLQFPVTMKGLEDAHLTLKFFGDARIDAHAIEKKLQIVPELNVTEFVWQPKFWWSPTIPHWVLAFTKYPTALDHMHGLFDIILDEHKPWTPHITVPKKYFLMVEDQAFTPADCELKFGEIELCLGGENV